MQEAKQWCEEDPLLIVMVLENFLGVGGGEASAACEEVCVRVSYEALNRHPTHLKGALLTLLE